MSKILFIVFSIVSCSLLGQENLGWKKLISTQYEIISEGVNQGLYKPKFTEELKNLENQEVIISGYLVPMDVKNDTYALSMSPFSS